MAWVYLFCAIVFEILGTTALKMSNGFSTLLPSILTIVFYTVCFVVFSQALKSIEVGIAYAIWCGLGIFIIALIGIVFFHETISVIKIISLLLIIIGCIGLKLAI